MKSIYISLPITGKEETYEARMSAAVVYVKAKYPQYERIVTPKELADAVMDSMLKNGGCKPNYEDYLTADILGIYFYCDAVFMCRGWEESKGCQAEHAFAKAIGIDTYFEIH